MIKAISNPLHSAIQTRLEHGILVSDGATGTNLLQRGLPNGVPSEQWVLEKPEEITRLYHDFIKSGSDIVLTCTFGASPFRLQKYGLSEKAEIINKTAVQIARSVAIPHTLVAGSIGPLGEMLEPYGTLTINELQDNHKKQARWLIDAGVDIILIETQFDIQEAKIAVETIMEFTEIPVICSFSFDRGTRTMMGVSPKHVASEFQNIGVFALGINCGKSIQDNLSVLVELRDVTDLPIWFKPNAGLPHTDEHGVPQYDLSPVEMGAAAHLWVEAGANIIGGCCGTSPEHLKAIAVQVKVPRQPS